MQIKHTCTNCGNELILQPKDIQPLTAKDKENIKRHNDTIDKLMQETKKNFWGKTILTHNPIQNYVLNQSKMGEVYGTITCPICKRKRYIREKE